MVKIQDHRPSFAARIKDDQGAALLTVILLVAVMSTAAVAFLDLSIFTLQTASRYKIQAQTREYARAAEILAAEKAGDFRRSSDYLALIGADLSARQVEIPIQGGAVRAILSAANNCFNLHSLAYPPEDIPNDLTGQSRDEAKQLTPAAQYQRLLGALGLGAQAAKALTAATTDWQDPDSRVRQGGAEDRDYARQVVPYAASNRPLADISELSLISGYTPALIAALKPYVCLRGRGLVQRLNINTMNKDHAPLLVAMIGHGLTLQEAQQLLIDRPVGGYDYLGNFWKHKLLENRNIPQYIRSLFGKDTDYYQVMIDVKYYDGRSQLFSLIKAESDGSTQIISRKFGN